jgi:hypothetical protein
MKSASEIQNYILETTGIKTSVKNGKGSMKGYVIFSPMFQNGSYPNIPFEFARGLIEVLKEYDNPLKPVFSTANQICVYGLPVDEKKIFKKERKQKPTENPKGWGSKNSQVRLNKAVSRYAKRLRNNPGSARYY